MPLKVQLPLPSIGLELYHQGVHIWAKKKKKKRITKQDNILFLICSKQIKLETSRRYNDTSQ